MMAMDEENWIALRQSLAARDEATVSWGAILQRSMLALLNGGDVGLKLAVLVLVEENVQPIFTNQRSSTSRLKQWYRCIEHVREQRTAPCVVQDQALVSLTAAMIEADALHACQPLFEGFMARLRLATFPTNDTATRSTRRIACECLRELELCYPGLLAPLVVSDSAAADEDDGVAASWSLLSQCREERSHVAEGYLVLYLTVVSHWTARLLHTSGGRRLADADAATVGRALSVALDMRTRLSTWSLQCLLARFALLATNASPPFAPEVLRRHLAGLAAAESPSLRHALLQLHSALPRAFHARDVAQIVQMCVGAANETGRSVPARVLAVEWLHAFPLDVLHAHYLHIWPRCFDPLELRAAKLTLLLRCFHRDPAHDAAPSRSLLDAVSCVAEFEHRPAASRFWSIALSFVGAVMERFPHLAPFAHRFFVRTVWTAPRFAPSVMALVRRLDASEDESVAALALPLLSALALMLSSIPAPSFGRFVGLAALVAREPRIAPCGLCAVLRAVVTATTMCADGDWQFGNHILDVTRELMVHHAAPLLLRRLAPTLAALARFHADVDIRDRARGYGAMLERLPSEMLRGILRPTPPLQSSTQSVNATGSTSGGRTVGGFDATAAGLGDSPPDTILAVDTCAALLLRRRPAEEEVEAVASATTGDEAVADGLLLCEVPTKLDIDVSTVDNDAAAARERATLQRYVERLATQLDAISKRVNGRGSARAAVAQSTTLSIAMPLHLSYKRIHEKPLEEASAGGDQLGETATVVDESDGASLSLPPLAPRIFGLIVEFTPTPYFEPIATIQLPVLAQRCDGDDGGKETEGPPFSYDIALALRPLAPVPVTLRVRLVCSDGEGRALEGALQSIAVELADLFLPPPLEQHRAAQLPVLFHALWEGVQLPLYGLPATAVPRSVREAFGDAERWNGGFGSGGGSSSVKLLCLPREEVLRKIEVHLGCFVVQQQLLSESSDGDGVDDTEREEDGEDEDGEEEWYTATGGGEEEGNGVFDDSAEGGGAGSAKVRTVRVLIFLMPRFHLLLKFRISPMSTLVRIRTDCWHLLAAIDRYFVKWTYKS